MNTINIIIAETLKWTDCHVPLVCRADSFPSERVAVGIPPGMFAHHTIPNFAGSLDAMRTAEVVLSSAQEDMMIGYLREDMGDAWGFATAPRRALAFLRVFDRVPNGLEHTLCGQ